MGFITREGQFVCRHVNEDTHHTDEDVAIVPESGEDVVHELLVPQPPLGLVVGGVVAVGDQQAGPGQPGGH